MKRTNSIISHLAHKDGSLGSPVKVSVFGGVCGRTPAYTPKYGVSPR
jgi:hypothetical protein